MNSAFFMVVIVQAVCHEAPVWRPGMVVDGSMIDIVCGLSDCLTYKLLQRVSS